MLTCFIRRHVLNDLRPYICTFQDCTIANESFASRAGFLDHEMLVHGRFTLDRLVDFDSDGIACLFCGEVLSKAWSKRDEYARHVGRHMEEIAFAVVTKPYEEWDFYSDSSGKSLKFEDVFLHPYDACPIPIDAFGPMSFN